MMDFCHSGGIAGLRRNICKVKFAPERKKTFTEKPAPLQVISNHPLFRRALSPSSSSFVRHTQTDAGLFVGLRLHAARVHPSSRRTDALTDEKKPAAALAIQHNPCNLLQHDSHSQEGAEWNLSGCRRPEAERGKKKKTHTEIFLFLIAIICLQRENNIYIFFYLLPK